MIGKSSVIAMSYDAGLYDKTYYFRGRSMKENHPKLSTFN